MNLTDDCHGHRGDRQATTVAVDPIPSAVPPARNRAALNLLSVLTVKGRNALHFVNRKRTELLLVRKENGFLSKIEYCDDQMPMIPRVYFGQRVRDTILQ